ncbi:MAG: hypothetical protein Q4A55_06330 [Aerococcus sp.]|nr:hypothetical protein [Aerococcus sp.]
MRYSKLPVILLSVIASEKHGSTNSVIATYILQHADEMDAMGIHAFAKACDVSMSSISRFCKEIGLMDFAELKQLIRSSDFTWDETLDPPQFRKRLGVRCQQINESLKQVANSIAQIDLQELVRDIYHYEKVAAFGLMKAETAALILQSDLLMSQKYIYTNLAYKEQMDDIETAASDTLIILFAYTGSYFKYNSKRPFLKKKDRAKIWMIAGDAGREMVQPSYVTQQIHFQSKQDDWSHPYQLAFLASMIADEYRRMTL